MELTVKITPRVAAQVARRLRLAASVRSRSMPAMVNDALDEALPSLEEIRMQLALPAAEATAAGHSPDLRLGTDGQVMLTRGSPAVSPLPGEVTGDGSGCQ
jgi:plasmid stability protein